MIDFNDADDPSAIQRPVMLDGRHQFHLRPQTLEGLSNRDQLAAGLPARFIYQYVGGAQEEPPFGVRDSRVVASGDWMAADEMPILW